MLWFLALGAAALFSPWMPASVILLLAGYGTMAVLDPIAARRREAPRDFRRLRSPQRLLLAAGPASLLVR
ncbi:hypothetical protein QMO56_18620 [Roseomonas sp. E05]|uniref:hypothetical protein n=1 Tax=Roseomonas sp. E05 TaxID=3046310 RepID=UPI0024B97ABA|nr:hypothetical protein [Roseomonas sp. E05]MDJ0390128.1 hypothetical protein [Roseomonas sp. E05]